MLINKIILTLSTISAAGIAAFAVAENRACKGSLSGEPDFLLILGCRVKGFEPEETLVTRIEAAAEYLKEHESVIAIACGGIVHSDQYKSEAEVIYDGLCERGIEPGRIIIENKSKTTQENFINAKALIEKMNLSSSPKLAFLSSEFHLLRASYIGKSCGMVCDSVPAKTPTVKRIKAYIRELIVFPAALKK